MIANAIDLHYFVEVATALNLTRAAERLGVKQPTISFSLRRLERDVGTPLVVRSKRGVSLTQAGKQLLLYARDLLQRWDAIKTQALASMGEVQGTYTLGCHPTVALSLLPQVADKLLLAHPKLELRLVHDLSRRITERIIQTDIDIGLVVNPVRHPDLIIQHLCDDEVAFWQSTTTKPAAKSDSTILICDPDLLQTQHLIKKLKRSSVRYHRILSTSSLELIGKLTASGIGIGIAPGRSVQDYALARVPDTPVYRDEICVVYRAENRTVRSIQAMAAALKTAFVAKR